MKKEELFAHYAQAALSALITKLPLLDTQGTLGQEISAKEIYQTKKELVHSAMGYAALAVKCHEEWIKEDWV